MPRPKYCLQARPMQVPEQELVAENVPGIEAAREFMDGRHENLSQRRLFSWDEISDDHALPGMPNADSRRAGPKTEARAGRAARVVPEVGLEPTRF